MTDPAHHASFESDEVQGHPAVAHVSVHPLDHRVGTLRLIPAGGNDVATRCERIRDTAWQALPISLPSRIAQVTDARQ